jgi:hypothetical protein
MQVVGRAKALLALQHFKGVRVAEIPDEVDLARPRAQEIRVFVLDAQTQHQRFKALEDLVFASGFLPRRRIGHGLYRTHILAG